MIARTCLGCGVHDTDPKDLVRVDAEGTLVAWHMDCHAAVAGCEVCARQIKGADGATGEALRAHLTSGTA